ncbi:MAG: PorT family protein [Bacteroidetes bacterium]|nr:PorT family protein [Bacteroidota bacterium]
MKKKICIIVAVLLGLTAMNSYSQGFELGAKFGANMFKVDGRQFDQEFRLGYNLGAFMHIKLNENWGIQPELLWSNINTKTVNDVDEVYNLGNVTDISLDYLSIPIIVTYSPVPVFSLQTGPQFGIMTNSHQSTIMDGRDAFTSGDMSWIAGAQLNLGPIKGGVRYVIGLNNINDLSEQEKWINNGLQIYLGFVIL